MPTLIPVKAVRPLRSALLLAALAAAALTFAQPAASAVPGYTNLTKTWGTAHVLVHYTDAAGDPDAVTLDEAKRLVLTAEQAFVTEAGWGFRAPSDGTLGGDSRLDIYVAKTPDGRSFAAGGFIPGLGNVALIQMDPVELRTPSVFRYRGVIAHEVFHTFQIVYAFEEPFLMEATAEWAGVGVSAADYVAARPIFIDKPEASLDCPGTVCGEAGGLGRGYGQWPFFEFLSERYGRVVIRQIFEAAATLQAADGQTHSLQAIDQALQLHRTTLSTIWNAYAAKNLLPTTYTNRLLRTIGDWRKPTELIRLAGTPAKLPSHGLEVDHLAATYVNLVTPTCSFGRTTPRGTLHLVVQIPPNVPSVPSLRITRGASKPVVKRLKVSGGLATLDVPRWGGCVSGKLALPNPSWTVDDAEFVVHVSVTRT